MDQWQKNMCHRLLTGVNGTGNVTALHYSRGRSMGQASTAALLFLTVVFGLCTYSFTAYYSWHLSLKWGRRELKPDCLFIINTAVHDL